MRSKRRVILLPSCVIALAAIIWWRASVPEQPAPQADPAPSAAAQDSAQPVATPSPGAEPPSPVVVDTSGAALPPDITALLARAQAGDAHAACDLGVRFQECFGAGFYTDRMLDQLRAGLAEAEARNDAPSIAHTRAMLLSGTSIREQCEGIPPTLYERASDFLRQAALAGQPEAIIRYVRGEALSTDPMQQLAFVRDPRFDNWRREALPLLEARLQAGHPEAVLAMLEARNAEGHWLTMIIPADPVLDRAYWLLARRLFGDHAALQRFRQTPEMTTEQQLDAERLAAQWHEDRFDGRQLLIEEHLSGMARPGDDAWPQPTRTSPPCNAELLVDKR